MSWGLLLKTRKALKWKNYKSPLDIDCSDEKLSHVKLNKLIWQNCKLF